MARIFITGSTDGLGRAAATSLMAQGHDVVLHARSVERARDLDNMNQRHGGIVIGDLSRGDDVRGVAAQVNALGRMDAVIHNAGIYRVPERGSTPEGHPTVQAVNILAPYMLTALITRPSRLVYLSSSLHRGGAGSLPDVDWRTRPWNLARAYAESKLQVAALAGALARRWPDVCSNAVDPGWARTRMGGATAPVSLEKGQQTQTWLAVSDDPAARVSGRYWRAMREEAPDKEVRDTSFQDGLVAVLATLTGVSLPD